MALQYTPNIPPEDSDAIISNAAPLLESFRCQKWPAVTLDYFPTSIPYQSANETGKPDCAIVFANCLGEGLMFLTHHRIIETNCGSVPFLPASITPGELPVMAMYANTDMIPFCIYPATMTYLYNHDQSELFFAVVGHVFPPWNPLLFPAGQRMTSAPPTIIADDVLEVVARRLMEHITPKQLESLKIHVEGFSHIWLSLNITDLGFQEVVLTSLEIVNKAPNGGYQAVIDDLFGSADLLDGETQLN
ncbi:uncharacterized protein EV420DRAFT_1397 [Desarmillaria tabescens]|uniref:Uncharacterized protein n=1 Tax=Armillaria tabescens TaxID=1929756 RepID=A0AA39NNQ4_ARMTA|nr:uncharacterized protein EV420DRAFT_1397 [Desarmillaria tabescens]KAK0468996.1 hypothetical protein EV420DRAFT_1397 [Desarmillaria tabescens]